MEQHDALKILEAAPDARLVIGHMESVPMQLSQDPNFAVSRRSMASWAALQYPLMAKHCPFGLKLLEDKTAVLP